MDKPCLKNWSDLIWNPNVSRHTSPVILLDDFTCHKQTPFLEAMQETGTHVEHIPGGYICLLQPCHVETMKSLKFGVRHHYTDWAIMKL